MKIYVNEMPTEPNRCLFARKEIDFRLPDEENGVTYTYKYFCNINMEECNMDCGGKCNKLRVLMK